MAVGETMVQYGHGRHRGLSIQKVENGFLLDAAFVVTRSHRADPFEDTESRRFVFYTVEEVTDFVKNYLQALPSS